MLNEYKPIIDQWYWHHDKGPLFCVTAIDDEERVVEVQHFDGDLEEITFAEWRSMQDIELGEEPENWSGSLDISEPDDFGTEVTDTRGADWNEPLSDYRQDADAPAGDESEEGGDDYGEGHMEEEPLDGEDAGIAGPPAIDLANVTEREDGVFEDTLDDTWYAEYREDPASGLWRASLYNHDVPEWRGDRFESLADAAGAAREYYSER